MNSCEHCSSWGFTLTWSAPRKFLHAVWPRTVDDCRCIRTVRILPCASDDCRFIRTVPCRLICTATFHEFGQLVFAVSLRVARVANAAAVGFSSGRHKFGCYHICGSTISLFNRRRAECNLACTHFARLGLLVGQGEGTAQRSTCYMVGFSGSPGPTAVVPTQDCGIPPRRTLAIPPLTTSLAKNGLDGTWAGLRPAPPASSWR